MVGPIRIQGSKIVLWDPEAPSARSAQSSAIKRAIKADISAQPPRGLNPYATMSIAASSGAGLLTLVAGVSSMAITGVPTILGFIGPLALLPFAALGDKMVYLSRLRRGKVAPATAQLADLGELQAEPIGKDGDR